MTIMKRNLVRAVVVLDQQATRGERESSRTKVRRGPRPRRFCCIVPDTIALLLHSRRQRERCVRAIVVVKVPKGSMCGVVASPGSRVVAPPRLPARTLLCVVMVVQIREDFERAVRVQYKCIDTLLD